eukprot:EG_transcript_17688
MRAARCLLRTFRIAVNTGDGIGADVVPAAVRVLELVERFMPHRFETVPISAGFGTLMKTGTPLPEDTLEICRQCDAAIGGPVYGPTRTLPGYFNPYVELRRQLDLYAQLTRCRTLPITSMMRHRPSLKVGVDILIVRENLEGFYIKQETMEETAHGRSAIALRRITEQNSRLVARCAFQQARKRRRLVNVVHKSPILTMSDGLFRETCYRVAQEFPDVAVEEQITEPFVCAMIRDPTPFDVVVMPNMYGDFISEVLAMLVGGLQFQAQSNVGDAFVLVHPLHGTADDLSANTANPGAMLRGAGLLLEKLLPEEGEELAKLIDDALFGVLQDGVVLPHDMGGSASTTDVTAACLDRLE